MDHSIYLCPYCLTLVNHPVEGVCEESPAREHEWLTGEDVDEQVKMIWEMPLSVIAAAGEKSGAATRS